jgi:hypothetical protein
LLRGCGLSTAGTAVRRPRRVTGEVVGLAGAAAGGIGRRDRRPPR